ncbi:unnamed protein product [Schistosoma margrebowiei]|uniref:Reverse transcriptase domain-containing protein n=1 Tax=Schistosoma margrebowiei TaxID=48269 RepID=A0A3P7YLG7_9TREM|nr:unnamed protein product [Schistosoma margrebowiei]
MDSVRIGRAQTELQHYGSSSNNQLSGTRHCTSTSLIMKRHLTMWIEECYGDFFDTMEFLNSYDGLQCKVVHGGQLTDAFQLRTGVRQGCLLSPFLFLLVVDWIMKTSTSAGKHGIQWTIQNK